MEILRREFDVAQKYRVLVQLDDGDAKMFKFQNEITDEAVLAEVTRYLEAVETISPPPEE